VNKGLFINSYGEGLNRARSYRLRNTLSKNLLNKIRANHPLKKHPELHRVREVSQLTFRFPENRETLELIEKIQAIGPKAATYLKGPVALLGFFTNKWDTSFANKPGVGSFVTEAQKQNLFGTAAIGKVNPEKGAYYLRKNAGGDLFRQAIADLQREGIIKTILLNANTPALESYYARFGFKTIPEKVVMLEIPGVVKVYYGDGDTGKLMYLHL
jgi:hypothetical protein